MAQGQISWGSVLVGALVGGGIAYAILRKQQSKKAAETKTEDKALPPAPGPEGGLGTTGGHRGPLPDTQVWVPQSAKDRQVLDQTICNVWNSYDTRPEPDDVVIAVLEELAPEGQWPAVPGDHASISSLQSIVTYRIEEIGSRVKTLSFADNFEAFCVESVTPPVPSGPQGLVG